MKKRIFYVLFGLLIFTAPSMVQAETSGESDGSVSTQNSVSSHQSLLGIHKLSNLIDGLGNLLVKDSESKPEQVIQEEAETETLIETESQSVEKALQTDSTSAPVQKENVAETTLNSLSKNVAQTPVVKHEAPAPVETNSKPLLSIGLLGLNINLLDGHNSDTGMPTSLLTIDASEDFLQPGSDLLSANLGLGTVGNVGLDLLQLPTVTETGELNGNSGLLGLNVSDSALLGEINVGLLSGSKSLTENGYTSSVGLANLGINNQLLNTNLGVLESSKNVSGDTTTYSGNIVSAGVTAPLIGELNSTIGGVSGLISPDRNEVHTSIVSADINNDLLGNNHVGVGEYHIIETDEGTTTSGGVVIVHGNDTPVGDIHVGVGEIGKSGDTDTTPLPDYPTNQGTGENSIPSGSANSGSESKTKPTEPKEDVKTSSEQEDEKVSNTDDEKISTNNQKLESLDATNSAVGEYLQTLVDAGSHTVLNQGVDETAQFGLELEKLNKKSADSTGITTAISAPSTSSSSTSTGSAGLSGGSGTFVDLISGYNLELSQNEQTQSILKTMSTQWTESPPVQPPIAPFFLAI